MIPRANLTQQEEQYLQNGDPQLTARVLLCLLLSTGLSAHLSSWLWWQCSPETGRLYVELQFVFSLAVSNWPVIYLLWKTLVGQTLEDTQRSHPMHGLPAS